MRPTAVDADGKTLYIAACDAVYKIRLQVAGVLEGPARWVKSREEY